MTRLRQFCATAVAAVALSAFGQVQAQADVLQPPTDFQLSWQGDKLHLTWKDNGEANVVYAEYPDLEYGALFHAQGPDDPNDVLLDPTLEHADRVRFYLATRDASGTSQGALTPYFDTQVPAPPVIEDAGLLPDLSVQVKWTLPSTVDKTPGDPLDRPDKVFAWVNQLTGDTNRAVPFPDGSTLGTVPTPDRPSAIQIVADSGWGDTLGHSPKVVQLAKAGAGISVPAQQVYSQRLGIKSTLDLTTYDGGKQRATGIPVELQARATGTDAWKTYGRYSGTTTAAFDTGIAALGNRQYRLWVPARKTISTTVIRLIPPASTSARSSVTLAKFTAAGFTPTTAQVGTTVKLSVKIQPAATVQGVLQRWDGKKWVNGAKIQLKNGTALVPLKASGRGTSSRYRVALGPIVFNGLHLNATQSPTFTLTVR